MQLTFISLEEQWKWVRFEFSVNYKGYYYKVNVFIVNV